MPSFLHDLIVELFRSAPELAPRLVRDVLGEELPRAPAHIGSADLTSAAPTTLLADLVVHIGRDPKRPEAAIIVEVQLGRDPAKRRAWCAYLGNELVRSGCPVYLLVVTPDAAMARWCQRPIPYGHPRLVLEPLVIHPAAVPEVTDPAQARRLPELAVLSAMVHGRGPSGARIGWAAVAGSAGVADDKRKPYLDVVLAALGAVARHELEKMMESYQYRSEFARKYVAQGVEQGRVEGLIGAALRLVESKSGTVPRGLARRLERTPEPGELEQLIVELGTAADRMAVREVLERHDLSPPRRKTTPPPPAPGRARAQRARPKR